eukprot:CAMPEP_0115017056 /NCGR_PEP_ID=MMETSP0216-20121206/27865_1 /TAXON_ID=223996 /ORGANISM="Protocruzia adherens, Strain Boccale" /LENGTH=861 /DNA_ID=CAMNT_0002387751 /DNA_START=257 /DNA_END=2839 /DNA_ORIENTATION=+
MQTLSACISLNGTSRTCSQCKNSLEILEKILREVIIDDPNPLNFKSAEIESEDFMHLQVRRKTIVDTGSKIAEIACDMATNLSIFDRKHMLKLYKRCFVGSEAVKYMIDKKHARSVTEAVELGNEMLRNRYFAHVTRDHDFKNEDLFYRFLIHEEDEYIAFENWNNQKIQKLNWNSVSSTGERWFRDSGAMTLKHQSAESYFDYLNEFSSETPAVQEDFDVVKKDVEDGRSDPSVFRIGLTFVQKETNFEVCRTNVINVLKSHLVRNSEVGYCQGMSFIVTFLLCFMDEEMAFWSFEQLVDNILVPDYYMGPRGGNSLNGYIVECELIKEIAEAKFPWFRQLDDPTFVELFGVQLLIQLFIDGLSPDCTIFLWNQIMGEPGYNTIIKAFLAIMAILKDRIEDNTPPFKLFCNLSELVKCPQLQETFIAISLNAAEIDRQREAIKKRRAQNWSVPENRVFSKLAKVTHFSREEIEYLQQEFTKLKSKVTNLRGGSFLGGGSKKNKARDSGEVFASFAGRDHAHMTEVADDTFHHGVKEQPLEDNSISRQELKLIFQNYYEKQRIVGKDFSILSQDEIIDRLFDVYDQDKTNSLDFREVITCLSAMTRGSIQERLELCFKLYDTDNSGYLSEEETEMMVGNLLRPYYRDLAELHSLDRKKSSEFEEESQKILRTVKVLRDKLYRLAGDDRKISFKEFYNGILSDPILVSLFESHAGLQAKNRAHRGQTVQIMFDVKKETKKEKKQREKEEKDTRIQRKDTVKVQIADQVANSYSAQTKVDRHDEEVLGTISESDASFQSSSLISNRASEFGLKPEPNRTQGGTKKRPKVGKGSINGAPRNAIFDDGEDLNSYLIPQDKPRKTC